jgi:hypothetical protein
MRISSGSTKGWLERKHTKVRDRLRETLLFDFKTSFPRVNPAVRAPFKGYGPAIRPRKKGNSCSRRSGAGLQQGAHFPY